MESMRSTWTDERLDDLNGRVSELSARIDALQHTMVNGFIAMMVALLTSFVGLAGLILTQI
ncbi:MAG TPA: hypothetical protein VG458_00315 [Solirubrobacterales bacterium]|nr:hypothetical protein [Solirubrobacterales bacterium]